MYFIIYSGFGLNNKEGTLDRKDFIKIFLNTFAKAISEKQLKTYRIGAKRGEFLWNLFAGGLIPCFSGDKARQEYDKANKVGAEEIQLSNDFISLDDLHTCPLFDAHKTAHDIDQSGLIEFYVIGKDFSWCYVVTHEGDLCGPYFCYAPAEQNKL